MNNIFIIKIFQETKDTNGIYYEEDFCTTVEGYFTSRENAAKYIQQKIAEMQADNDSHVVEHTIFETGCANIIYAHGYKRRYYTIKELSLID